MKKITKIILFSFILIVIILIAYFIFKNIKTSSFTSLEITINNKNDELLIDEKQIEKLINDNNIFVLNKNVEESNLSKLNSILNNTCYIKNYDIVSSFSGKYTIKIDERIPVARLFNDIGQNFYISYDGYLMPINNQKALRILIANGKIKDIYTKCAKINENIIDTVYSKNILFNIWKISKYIYNNPFLKAQISQIYVNDKNEIELIPTIGNHTVVFGNIENYEQKFKNLIKFYQKAIFSEELEKYSIINIKYSNQIICNKKSK